MGADMCIESIAFKATPQNEIDEESAKQALDRARKAITTIDEPFLATINDEQCNDYQSLAEYQSILLGDLEAVELALFGVHRQAMTLVGGHGIVLLVAGGMSWGDSPTELFESMYRLQEAGVIPDARWPDPPDAASTDTTA
jgi:hypothetical protein